MTRLAELQSQTAGMAELQEIVGAMHSLAGMRMQEAQRALQGIRGYAQAMKTAIGAALELMPPPAALGPSGSGRRALVLFAGEHGFVGGFNEHLIDAAQSSLGPDDLLFVLGERAAALVVERGVTPAWFHSMATRPAGAQAAVDQLAGELYRRIARGEIARVELLYSRPGQGGRSDMETRLLLPLDTARLAAAQPQQPPLHNLEPRRLLEQLAREYVLALLTEAVVESIASENAARFAAMEQARENVAKTLSELRAESRQVRQNEITAEMLDLLIGVAAQGRPGRSFQRRQAGDGE